MLQKVFRRTFSTPGAHLISATPGQVDILYAQSNNILMNLATEAFIFDHLNVVNPLLFLWRNTKTIIIGKHQNPWKECRVQKLEDDGVVLARRASGGGAVYQDLGNSVFSFINPVDAFEKVDFKTLNNEILVNGLQRFGIEAIPTGRNDLIVKHEGDRKISGSAYKLKLGDKHGRGKRSLHHGTMLLDLELDALGKYLNPSKAKLESKGVQSVISRVINLKELNADLNHDSFCGAIEDEFIKKWGQGKQVNRATVLEDDLMQIPKLMEIYNQSADWEWRFGQTPDFQNSLEKKFAWALVDIMFNVQNGVIIKGESRSCEVLR